MDTPLTATQLNIMELVNEHPNIRDASNWELRALLVLTGLVQDDAIPAPHPPPSQRAEAVLSDRAEAGAVNFPGHTTHERIEDILMLIDSVLTGDPTPNINELRTALNTARACIVDDLWDIDHLERVINCNAHKEPNNKE